MLYDYSSAEATSSGQCSNSDCREPIISSDPPSGSQVNFPTYVKLTSDVDGAVIYYTIDGTTPDTLSPVYSGPILIASAGVTLRAIASKEGCSPGPILTATYSNPLFPFAFSYACDTPDKAGQWDVFAPNGISDHHWVLQFILSGAQTIKRLELYQLDATGNWTTGQVWSTDSPINPVELEDEFEVFPLLIFIAAVQQWVAYQDTLGSFGAGSHTWDLYGDTVIPASGLFRIDIILGDDTKLSQTIASTCTVTPPVCVPPAAPTLTAKCAGAVDVTFSGTVGQNYVIYYRSDICLPGEGWQEAASGTLDVSPKTVEVSGLTAGCLYDFYVSVSSVGCGFRDSNPASTIPLRDPTVSISTNKTIVDPNESFTISWSSNNIGGAVCGGCLDGQVSINQSMGCKAGNAAGSQAQSQAVCGIYTYQITGCNTCGTAVASVQVEVRCATTCGLCQTSGPDQLWIANPLTFMGSLDDWCCKDPVVCGPSNCGPGSTYTVGTLPSYVAWNGLLVPSNTVDPASRCNYADNLFLTGNTNLGGSPGATPNSYPWIRVSIVCSALGKWFLSIRCENNSSAGCFTNWWTGEKLTGQTADGVYTRISGCSPHPASITVSATPP